MIVLDDVGWSDFGYQSAAPHNIPTRHIDELSSKGVRLGQHYSAPTCTPTRASLLTGRYPANTGLNLAMVPGSDAGLPLDMLTLPQALRRSPARYEARAVGKWHLGHSRWTQTPVGRGFQSHVGSFMWGLDSHSKTMHREPWGRPLAMDWVRCHENGTYHHYLEPRHATLALTSEAEDVMRRHVSSFSQNDNDNENDNDDETKKETNGRPLFLYLAYTAAHSPLQPASAEHLEACGHIPHEWRRLFCGMMVGLDEAVQRVTESARSLLGDNLVVLVTSDNGGSTWLGGMNQPLRSGKTTPFEGGVRVPSFVVDCTPDGRYFGAGGRRYEGLLHVSDWFPTLLSIAGYSDGALRAMGLDGVDVGPALRGNGLSPREEVLLDMYYANETVFDSEWIVGIRRGDYKLIEGHVRDPHWYFESTADRLNTTDTDSWVAPVAQWAIWLLERLFGLPASDTMRVTITHAIAHGRYSRLVSPVCLLFDVVNDPAERTDLSAQLPDVVDDLRRRAECIRAGRPPQAKAWMQMDLQRWPDTFVAGDCSQASAPVDPQDCRFTHPWLPDRPSEGEPELLHIGVAYYENVRRMVNSAATFGGVVALLLFAVYLVSRLLSSKVKSE